MSSPKPTSPPPRKRAPSTTAKDAYPPPRTITQIAAELIDLRTQAAELGSQVVNLTIALSQNFARKDEVVSTVDYQMEARVLAEVIAVEHRLRQRDTRRLTVIAVVLLVGLGYTRVRSVQQTHERVRASHVACVASNERTEVQANVLDDIAGAPATPDKTKIAQGADRLRSLEVDCDDLFPIPGGKK